MSSAYCESDVETYRHRMPLQIRFNDIDMLGHLNNSVYLTMMDLAKARYFEAANGGPVDIRTIGVEIEVETATLAIGEKSLTLEQRIYAVRDHQVKCTCRTIMSGFDIRTNTSIPISEEWIEKLERYEGRPLLRKKNPDKQ